MSARAGTAFPANGIGEVLLGVDQSGALAPIPIGSGDTSTTGDTNVPSAATAAVLSYSASAGVAHGVFDITWSYSAAPTGGRLTMADGSDTILDIDITSAGPGQVRFDKGRRGHSGRAMTITLASGAGAVVGKLNASHYVIDVVAGGMFDFGDEVNSGLIGIL